jgi:ribosomal protein L29
MIKKKLDNTSRVSEKELSQAEYDRLIDREDAHNYSKKEMSLDQLRRQWQLITLIPGYQRPKTIANLSSRIGDSDDPSFLRKIQRDIAQLKEVIGDDLLVERRGGAKGALKDRRILEGGGQNVAKSDDSIKGARGAPLQVSWSKNGPPIKVSSLSQTEAIAFGVLKQIGVDWMPDTMQDALRPYFNEAFEEAAMQVESNKGISSIKSASMTKKWLNKVRYIPSRDIVFIPPKILPKVFHSKSLGKCQPVGHKPFVSEAANQLYRYPNVFKFFVSLLYNVLTPDENVVHF